MSGDSIHPPRTLVLCFDGTANQYDGDVSRRFLFIRALLSHYSLISVEHKRCEVLFSPQKRLHRSAIMLLSGMHTASLIAPLVVAELDLFFDVPP